MSRDQTFHVPSGEVRAGDVVTDPQYYDGVPFVVTSTSDHGVIMGMGKFVRIAGRWIGKPHPDSQVPVILAPRHKTVLVLRPSSGPMNRPRGATRRRPNPEGIPAHGKIRVLVAPDKVPTRGYPRPTDFVWTTPDELVGAGSACCKSKSCGCGRAFIGKVSRKGTTFAQVVWRDAGAAASYFDSANRTWTGSFASMATQESRADAHLLASLARLPVGSFVRLRYQRVSGGVLPVAYPARDVRWCPKCGRLACSPATCPGLRGNPRRRRRNPDAPDAGVRKLTPAEANEYLRVNRDLDCEGCGYAGLDPSEGAIWVDRSGATFCSKGCATRRATRGTDRIRRRPRGNPTKWREGDDGPCPGCGALEHAPVARKVRGRWKTVNFEHEQDCPISEKVLERQRIHARAQLLESGHNRRMIALLRKVKDPRRARAVARANPRVRGLVDPAVYGIEPFHEVVVVDQRGRVLFRGAYKAALNRFALPAMGNQARRRVLVRILESLSSGYRYRTASGRLVALRSSRGTKVGRTVPSLAGTRPGPV